MDAASNNGWGSLNERERQIVALVVDGLTNSEIGDELGLSRSAVKWHLANIFRKLGVTSRTQVAVMATRRSQEREDLHHG